MPSNSPSIPRRRVEIAVIGAGFTGIGMAIVLKQAGIEDFEVLERADDLGGTWRENSYPGCAVDVQSHLYSFSFAPNPDWRWVYAPQAELWAYIKRCAERFGVTGHLRFGHDVRGAHWDEAQERWRIDTAAGVIEARFLISAMGPLSERAVPSIPGLQSFSGALFHSAAWDHRHDLTGKRVAVLGTGASAAQIIPAIQPAVGRLFVFQRTPPWLFPRMNRRITSIERAVYRRYPAVQRLVRTRQYWYRESMASLFQRPSRAVALEAFARLRLRRQIRDPELRRRLTPDYHIGCKRIIVSDDYHPAFAKPNVELVTDPIREVTASSVVSVDGTEREVDTIVLATGFHPISIADPLVGRDGVALSQRWAVRRQAYLGTTVAGYPNYFMLMGPNTATGHTSVLLYAEAQMNYIVSCLEYLRRNRLSSCEVRADRQARFNCDLHRRLAGTVWTSGGCGSWYLDRDGGTSVIWPGYTPRFRRALRAFDPEAYVMRARAAASAPADRVAS